MESGFDKDALPGLEAEPVLEAAISLEEPFAKPDPVKLATRRLAFVEDACREPWTLALSLGQTVIRGVRYSYKIFCNKCSFCSHIHLY